jgi:(R,R)-butanediol dehydrogenase/meso-butanediol dehydrogenase/diacetyl reductase
MAMKSAQLHAPEDMRVDEVDAQPLAEGTVRVDIAYTGICGSDVHEYKIGPVPVRAEDRDHEIPESEWDDLLPKPMGHEISGVVSEVGNGVESVDVGEEVALNILIPCGECRYCKEGKFNLCTTMDGAPVGSPGFAESIVVPAEAAVPLPDGVSLRHAALAEPLSVSVHGVRRSGIQVGDTVAVFGAGPIGLGVVDAAMAAGARRVLVSEPREARREAAVELGADIAVDPRETDVIEHFKRETDGGVDISFEVAGVSETLTGALRSTKYDGTVVVLSVFEAEAQIHPNDIMQAERNVRGSFAYNGDYPATLQMMADGRLSPETFITGEITLDEISEKGFERLVDPESEHIKILVSPE